MSEQGPFNRREGGEPGDNSGRTILIVMGVVAVVLFLLFASPFKIFGGDDDGGGSALDGVTDGRNPGIPDGFQALSIHFDDLEKPANTEGPYALTMPLLEQVSDGRNLGLYTLEDGRWRRLAAATLVSNGTAASGEVEEMPSNLAVLRLLSSAVQITGWLPAGANDRPARGNPCAPGMDPNWPDSDPCLSARPSPLKSQE
jgi:hypothetical protein